MTTAVDVKPLTVATIGTETSVGGALNFKVGGEVNKSCVWPSGMAGLGGNGIGGFVGCNGTNA